MKSKFLKKIIAVTVVGTSISSFASTNAFAVGASNYNNWQSINSGQGNYGWRQNNGKWYYFNYDGIMQTGWVYDNSKWYYIDSTGVMQTGVIQIKDKIYLFSESGSMQTGNAVIDGKYYTFDGHGAAVGKNIPTTIKAFDVGGATAIPYTHSQIITDEDSSPSDPNTEARDPNNLTKYNVVFKDDDGDEFSTKIIEKNEKLTLYKPTRTGYDFVEWTTKKNGNGKSYDSGDQITIKDNITLYAQWEKSASNTDTSTTNKVPVEDIIITSSTSLNTIITKAGVLQMNAKVLPVDATDSTVTWSVNDTSIATISSSGLLTAVANGTVSVIATAKDTSMVVGRANITISGQADSGNTNTGGNTDTQTGGTIVAFNPNVTLNDVTVDTEGNIVDLLLLKASGKLPTKAKVTGSLSNGTVKDIEVDIKDWSGTYNGTIGTYSLTATLGNLPSGYTTALSLPTGMLKVTVTKLQNDNRKAITGAASIAEIPLDSDKHIMNTTLLNASGILPKTVTLNYDGGTVVANVNAWKYDSTNAFDGSLGIKDLIAEIESPVGYIVGSTVLVKTTLNVKVAQTANVQELVGFVDGSLVLNYYEGDKLNLSGLNTTNTNGLTVNVKYNDGTTGQISYADFVNNNISTPGYYNQMPLYISNSNIVGIPIKFNEKTVYTGALKVAAASVPTLKADGITDFDTKSTTPSAVTFSYTLGTGKNAYTGIDSITLGGVLLVKDTDYSDDATTKKLTILNSSKVLEGKGTPSTSALKVIFIQGTSKLTLSSTLGFISTPNIPSISLGTNMSAKDNTIKLLNLINGTTYEYCVADSASTTPNWSNAKYFKATDITKEVTDISFVADKNLYIRVKSMFAGGAVNPPSNAQQLTLNATNIGRTLSSEKLIKSFSLVNGTESYVGTITEGTASTPGNITVVVPTLGHDTTPIGMDVSNLTANLTFSDKAKVTVGGTVYTNGINGITLTANNFTNPVPYTVTAEDGTTKNYTVTVIKTELQPSIVRSDTLYYPVTQTVTVDGVTTTTTTNTPFNILSDGYEKAVINVDSINKGIVSISMPSLFDTDVKKVALDKIRELTPYTNPQLAYVGMLTTKPYDTATNVKVAASLDDLKNGKNVIAVQLSIDGTNTLNKQYLEQIPVAIFSSGTWQKVSQSTNTKYYAWSDSTGKVLGYTSLTIKLV